ncbi:MAG TPA: VOC family protein [Halanaerobiales bacterium]|nr:VOC family protein [Halanaerobiales bacterium]
MDFLFNTIEVSKLEKSFDFYTEILNLEVARRIEPEEGVKIVFLEDQNKNTIELIEREGRVKPIEEKESKIKMGFGVDNLDKTIEFLKRKDIEIKAGPFQIKGGRFINIEDPDGVMIGLYEFE